MFKTLIAPVQAWLLAQGHCVGCSLPLAKAPSEKLPNGNQRVTCKCGRIFIHEAKSQKYRRALFEEV